MFQTNEGIIDGNAISRINSLKQKQNNRFLSNRMGGNITLILGKDANKIGRKYILEFATKEKYDQIIQSFKNNNFEDVSNNFVRNE
jgi:hypothetical protein